MHRRNFFKGLLAAPAMPAAAAEDYTARLKGLPPLTIKDVKVIATSGGRNYRWLFLKIVTSEAGLYGIGSANDNYQTFAVAAALEKHLKPWLIGKDPDRIEDLWQSANFRTYWRGGPVNNKVVAAMDEALWDIKGKRAGMPVYELLGGRAHDAVACYDHIPDAPKSRPRRRSRGRWRAVTGTSACSTATAATVPIANPICSRQIDLQTDVRSRHSPEANGQAPVSTVRLAIRNRSCACRAIRIGPDSG